MSARALIAETTLSGVKLWVEGDSLHYAGPREVLTPDLVERMRHHKTEIVKLLEVERRRLEEADRRGLVIKWAKERGWIALHDPTTGEWHEVRASECPPSVRETANRRRRNERVAWSAKRKRV